MSSALCVVLQDVNPGIPYLVARSRYPYPVVFGQPAADANSEPFHKPSTKIIA